MAPNGTEKRVKKKPLISIRGGARSRYGKIEPACQIHLSPDLPLPQGVRAVPSLLPTFLCIRWRFIAEKGVFCHGTSFAVFKMKVRVGPESMNPVQASSFVWWKRDEFWR
jgi:hypothetical protein